MNKSDADRLKAGENVRCADCGRIIRPGEEPRCVPGIYGEVYCPECHDKAWKKQL